jgi:hypothetical protein
MSPAAIAVKAKSSTVTRTRISRAINAWGSLGIPIELVFRHFEKRRLDLAMSVAMLGESTLLMFSPASVSAGAFGFMPHRPDIFIMFFLIFGALRIVALGLNGHWMPYGSYARAIGAGVGAFLWAVMAAALWVYGRVEGHELPPGFPVFATLSLFEVVSIYSALIGARRWQEHGRSD